MAQQYQVVSYSGNTANADDRVWNGEAWTMNWRDALPVAQKTAESIKANAHGHTKEATIGIQKFFPF